MPDDRCTTSVLRFCPLNTTHRGGISLGSTSVPLQFWRRYLLLLVPALELNLNRRICHVLISRMNPARRPLARVEITHLELARSPVFQCAPLVRSGVRMSFFFLRSSGYKNSTMCNITGVRPGRRQTLTGYKPRAANSSLGLSSRVLLSRSFITQAIIRRLAVTTCVRAICFLSKKNARRLHYSPSGVPAWQYGGGKSPCCATMVPRYTEITLYCRAQGCHHLYV